LNVGDAMLIEWARNLQGLGVSIEDASERLRGSVSPGLGVEITSSVGGR